MEQVLSQFFSGEISLATSVYQLIGALVLSLFVRFYFIKMSTALTSRYHVANMIPMLTGVTFLVILVVKSSLALSLGLVGALSIVRFRTPVKEPEELVYIFLAMSIGLGSAAGHLVITYTVTVLILLTNWIRAHFWRRSEHEYNLVIEVPVDDRDSAEISSGIMRILQEQLNNVMLSKLEIQPRQVTIVAKLPFDSNDHCQTLVQAMLHKEPKSHCTVFDTRPSW